jgi:hypothetical protein
MMIDSLIKQHHNKCGGKRKSGVSGIGIEPVIFTAAIFHCGKHFRSQSGVGASTQSALQQQASLRNPRSQPVDLKIFFYANVPGNDACKNTEYRSDAIGPIGTIPNYIRRRETTRCYRVENAIKKNISYFNDFDN